MSIKIIADSTCDLTEELLQNYEIDILPLHVVLGDKEYRDGVDIFPEDIYEWSDKNNTTPKTSAPSIEDAVNLLKKCSVENEEIICFSISSQMSTTINVMKMAAAELEMEEKVFVIDSASLSTGIGLLVIEAAIMAQNGTDAKTIVAHIESLKEKVQASFVVDTLTYLHRGGRCSGVTALAGEMLKIHPSIVVADGAMKPDKKYRGKMQRVITSYVKDLEPQLRNAKKDRVFITHSGCDKEIIDQVYEYLKNLEIFDEILITRAGSVISSHCGPGTLGVLFIS